MIAKKAIGLISEILTQRDLQKSEHIDTKMTEKAIVFSQWTRMLDLLEAHLKSSHVTYRRLDGTMSVAARDKAVNDFNTVPEVCNPWHIHIYVTFSSMPSIFDVYFLAGFCYDHVT